ncbi:MAG TPA: nitroreductase/quinone reductase family protein [Candidatus Binatia bacterium]|jgi:hypothetical protein|nr:nitroreductase/quinone reductase family protein [Candidatus Binatia bacterium]
MTDTPYLAPTGVARWFNRLVGALGRYGVSLYGAQNLAVRGRSSGEWRVVPVNPLPLDGERYLVAPRGVTQWVRNVRAGGAVELRLGKRHQPIRITELGDDAKPPVLRAYLRKWAFEVKEFFPGVDADASDDALRAIAARYPVFRIER